MRKLLGYIYFIFLFNLLLIRPVHAYIDPSVMTYAIQAIAGIGIALGAFFGIYWRKIRRKLTGILHLNESRSKNYENDQLEFTDPEIPEKAEKPEDIEVEKRYLEQYAREHRGTAEAAEEEKEYDPSLRERITGVLPQALFLIMTVCIFMPSSLFLGNIDEFLVDYPQIIPFLLVFSLAAAAVIILAAAVCRKKIYLIGSVLVFGLAAAFYIQGNFLNPSFSVMNGTEIDWSQYTKASVISVVFWVLLLAVPVVLAFKKRSVTLKAIKAISIFVAAMQAVTLVYLLATTHRSSELMLVSKNREFELSANENTIVFVVDTLDTQWFEEYLMDDPAYADYLKDFTYFEDVVSGGAPTILGMPAMFTGELYDCTVPMDDYFHQAYENTHLFEDLQKAGSSVRLYTEAEVLNGADLTWIDNITPNAQYRITDYTTFGKYLIKLTGFYSLPTPVKKYFWFYAEWFNFYVGPKDGSNAFDLDDPQFYQDMISADITADDPKNAFILYHLFGAHGPSVMNENCEKIPESEGMDAKAAQMRGCMKIITEFIDEMKELGVYENCTFIITADHGGVDLYQNPAVLVKLPGTRNSMGRNAEPLTFRNLYAQYAATALDDYSSYGKTLFEDEGNTAVRMHTAQNILRRNVFGGDDLNISDFSVFEIRGYSRDIANVTIAE